jgi:hypothetical protein
MGAIFGLGTDIATIGIKTGKGTGWV